MKIASDLILQTNMSLSSDQLLTDLGRGRDGLPVFTIEQAEIPVPLLKAVGLPEAKGESADASVTVEGEEVVEQVHMAPDLAASEREFPAGIRDVEAALMQADPRADLPQSQSPKGDANEPTKSVIPINASRNIALPTTESLVDPEKLSGVENANKPTEAKLVQVTPFQTHLPQVSTLLEPEAPKFEPAMQLSTVSDMRALATNSSRSEAGLEIAPRPPQQTLPMQSANVVEVFERSLPVSNSPAEVNFTGQPQPATRIETVSPAPSAQPMAKEIAAQIVDQIKPFRSGGMELQLSPKELGTIHIRLVPSDAGVVVSIAAERFETAELIRRHSDVLLQEFRQAGYGGETSLSFSGRETGQREPQHFERPHQDTIPDDQSADPLPTPKLTASQRLNLVI